MILWTIQPMSVYRQLVQTGVFRCDPQQSSAAEFDDFAAAYQWMCKQLVRKTGPAPTDGALPLWGWYRREGQHKRPDLRHYRDYDDQVCIEFEIPEEKVLLSEFDNWHAVLNDCYLSDAHSEAEWQMQEDAFEALPTTKQKRAKHQSWQRIFDIDRYSGEWGSGDTIQGCFWELRLSQVRQVLRQEKGHRMTRID